MPKPSPPPASDQQPSGLLGFGFVLLIVVLLAYTCSDQDNPTPYAGSAAPSASSEFLGSDTAPAETGPPPQIAAAAVLQAAADAGRAIGALNASGARLYSENCYALLTSSYSAATRDRCLAFDLLAARATSDQGDLSEAGWFDETAIRSRYLGASSLGGETAEAAQSHFASVASLAQNLSVTPVAPPDPIVEMSDAVTETATLPALPEASPEATAPFSSDTFEALGEEELGADPDPEASGDVTGPDEEIGSGEF